MTAVPVEHDPAPEMIAAATRLRDAWSMADLDVGEMREAALGLIDATGTKDIRTALEVLHYVESDHDLRRN
jgi:hypothetical protein